MQTNKLLVVAVVGLLFLTISGWSKYLTERRYAAEQLDAVNAEKAQLSNAFARLMSENSALDRQRRVLDAEHRVLQRRFAALGDDDRDLQQASNGVQGQLIDTVARRDRLSEDLADTREAQVVARGEFDDMLAQRSRLMSQLGLARELVERVRSEVGTGSGDTRQKLDQLNQSEQLLGLLGQRLTSANDEIRTKSRDLERLNVLVTALGDELQSTKDEIVLLHEEVEKRKEANRMAWSRLQNLKQRLAAEMQSRKVEVEQLQDNLTIIRLGGDIVFDSGAAELRPAGARALGLIADALSRFPDRHISLEGHTDEEPAGAGLRERFPSNWELSSARAARAARFLMTRGIDPRRLRAVGYAQYRPAVITGDRQALAGNRRIEIVLLPAAERVVISSLPR